MVKPTSPKTTGQAIFSEPSNDVALLPPRVAAMRRKILEACARRDVEALRIPIDWNEVRPLFERGAKRAPGEDPIERLKALSFDGKGEEIVSILRAVLRQSWVQESRGPTRTFIWPAFALKPPADSTPEERQIMLTCVRFADLGRNDASGRPIPMRIGIGSDGTWHYFWSVDVTR